MISRNQSSNGNLNDSRPPDTELTCQCTRPVIYLPFFEDAGDRLTTEFRLTTEEVASLRLIEVPTGKLENAKTR